MDYEKVISDLIEFRNSRNWQKYHNLKSLAISLNIEASEVLEHFQWSEDPTESDNKKDSLEMEIADVLTYTFYMCEKLGVNPMDLVEKKLNMNKNRKWKFSEPEKQDE